MKFAWITDPHFDFISKPQFINFALDLEEQNLAGLILTGDISNGLNIKKHLVWLQRIVGCPVYYVLGNHDRYRSSFAEVNKITTEINSANLLYLSRESKPITLCPKVALIGNDGWYDAYYRIPKTPIIFLLDWYFIKEFKEAKSNQDRLKFARQLAHDAAMHIAKNLLEALKEHDLIFLATHWPPWPEQYPNWFGLAEKFWMPYNSSKIMAETLVNIMDQYPNKKLMVLGGHTHRKRIEKISHNIELQIGGVLRGMPEVQSIITL